jgi:hypothetical protein
MCEQLTDERGERRKEERGGLPFLRDIFCCSGIEICFRRACTDVVGAGWWWMISVEERSKMKLRSDICSRVPKLAFI